MPYERMDSREGGSGVNERIEAARASTNPMVASHTAARAVHARIHGKPDEVIRAIADTGGYVGICAIPRFLGRREMP